ncbi:phosphoglycerate mutase family protein [Actinoplanes sp. NPDC051859]|uniref:phosphoglycerate mutase family protein n=1 Tax=Actinoplanes sp. NPDC051859 TaxID=3363909 RepID=UPI0037B2BFF8
MITTLLVRHGEIDLPPTSSDPDLNAAGRARAEALAHVAGSAGVATVFTSALKRTKQTAGPLLDLLGIDVWEMPPPTVIVPRIAAGEFGQVVLIVGHSNTVPQVIAALGVPTPPVIGETDFDNLFVVTAGELLRLKYGD